MFIKNKLSQYVNDDTIWRTSRNLQKLYKQLQSHLNKVSKN